MLLHLLTILVQVLRCRVRKVTTLIEPSKDPLESNRYRLGTIIGGFERSTLMLCAPPRTVVPSNSGIEFAYLAGELAGLEPYRGTLQLLSHRRACYIRRYCRELEQFMGVIRSFRSVVTLHHHAHASPTKSRRNEVIQMPEATLSGLLGVLTVFQQ